MKLYAQLVLGHAERRRFSAPQIFESVERAITRAKLDAILFWPSGEPTLDSRTRSRIRQAGAQVHLWLPVLADAGQDPDEQNQTEDAWGKKGHGESGAWSGLGKGDETFLFACPRSKQQTAAARERIQKEAPDYDGVFLDRIRYPSPANGFEALFTCFCPRCREAEPEAKTWRARIRELRKQIASASNDEAANWKSFDALATESGLDDFVQSRTKVIHEMVADLTREIRRAGTTATEKKTAGLDLFTPAIAKLTGQEYNALAPECDWLKPMSYCHAKGPAGLPLELASFARGVKAWNKNLDEQTIMAFASRSFGCVPLPETAAELEANGLPEDVAGKEYETALRATGAAGTKNIYPGFECVRHPDFDLRMTEAGVSRYLDALSDAPGLVPAWNILYAPEEFLALAAKGR